MSSIEEQLFALQTGQLDHDELFHKEITRLNIHQRLNHMALHFAKYSGNICNCILNSNDETVLRKNIIDSFIISITCFNTLNIRISDKLAFENIPNISSIDDLGRAISSTNKTNTEDPLWLVRSFPVIVGNLAKACESVDHLEPYAYRESITENVVAICSLMLAAASFYKIDLITEVPSRLLGVKKKSIFFDHYVSR
ncbi:MAG: hypothetical protein CTY19_06140 [Methylomonas sp.]|nr:MAG: hypothetical protein CTY19_06140 [Methylomonas sp.]